MLHTEVFAKCRFFLFSFMLVNYPSQNILILNKKTRFG